MRVMLSLASLFLIGCCAYAAEADAIVGPGVVGDASAESQGPGYMLAFPMDEAGMVAAESDPAPQVATLVKEEEAPVLPVNTVSSPSMPETKPNIRTIFPQPSEADRRRKIEEMRKILGYPANFGQKPKSVPFEKPKPLLFPSLMKVLPRLDSSPLSSLPLALIRRSDEEGPKMLHGLIRQAATVFMRRALTEDEPDVQDVSENKGKKDSLFFLLDDDKDDAKEEQKKGSKDDDEDDDEDISFIPLPRPMLPIPGPFRGGLPTPPFGLPRRPPQMMHRRPSNQQLFPPMGPPPELRRGPSNQPPQAPTQPVMLILHPFMAPPPMMVPQPSVIHPMAMPHHPFMPHPMMLPPPSPFHPHPFMAPHPMMMPPHGPQFFMEPHHQFLLPPHPPVFPLPQHHPMFFPQQIQPFAPQQMHPFAPQQMQQMQPSAPQQVLFRPVPVPEYHTLPIESPEESEESPFMVLYEDPQPQFHHHHHQLQREQQQQQQQQQIQIHPQPQFNARQMPGLLSPLRRMQMLKELIMAKSLQMSPRAAFHSPVPPRMPQGDSDVSQSLFRPVFMPMG